MNGIISGIKHHRNFKIQIFLAIFAIIFGIAFQINSSEWMAIIISIFMVLGAELINTAIEILLDKIHPERDAQIGLAKDIAAGAVLVICTGALLVGLIIFLPKLNH